MLELASDEWILHFKVKADERISLKRAMIEPLYEIHMGREELTFALVLLSVGVEQTGFKLSPLLGGGKRFMQDEQARYGVKRPIGDLLLRNYSENEQGSLWNLLGNDDNQDKKLCKCCAGIALYAHTQFCGEIEGVQRAGNLANKALYIKEAETLEDTIKSNLITTPVSEDAYFSTTNHYYLHDATILGECSVCSKETKLIDSFDFLMGDGEVFYTANPHVALTRNNGFYRVERESFDLEVIEGTAFDSSISISPLAIKANAKLGDDVMSFGTCYEEGRLKHAFAHTYKLSNSFHWLVINQCFIGVCDIQGNETPLSVEDKEQVWLWLMLRIALGRTTECGRKQDAESCLHFFEQQCPEPPKTDKELHFKWRSSRQAILLFS